MSGREKPESVWDFTQVSDPEPGQVWQGPTSVARAREIEEVVEWPHCKAVKIKGGHTYSIGEWRAWVKKTRAILQEPPSP